MHANFGQVKSYGDMNIEALQIVENGRCLGEKLLPFLPLQAATTTVQYKTQMYLPFPV